MEAFDVGDTVLIKDGPFANFTGVVQAVDSEKIVVTVDVFGRSVGVDVPFSHAQKIRDNKALDN